MQLVYTHTFVLNPKKTRHPAGTPACAAAAARRVHQSDRRATMLLADQGTPPEVVEMQAVVPITSAAPIERIDSNGLQGKWVDAPI